MNEIAALLRDFGQGASNAAASNVSGPVDLLAWALRKGGVPVPSNPILGSEWMRQKGLLADPRNKIAGLLGEAAGLSAPIAAAAKAPQIARGLLAADDTLTAGANRMADHFERTGAAFKGPPNQRGAIVWHGSPHKFDKFDSSKIGTGEGAQAYGHGLYLAESPDVASAYKKNLSKDTFVSPNGSVINRAKLADFGFDRGDIDVMLGAIQRHNGDFTAAADAMASHRPTAAKFLKGIGQQGSINEGSLYKVDLPDNAIARMLDWDKPLSQQAPEVQKALNSINPAASKTAEQIAAAQKAYEDANYLWMSRPSGLPKDVEERLAKGAGQAYEDWQQMVGFGDKKGAYIYNQLARGKPYSAGSEALRQAGIPGIRYLDGGSRGAGAGTSNYVVFPGEESALQILERNGNPINALVQALKGPR